jgi:lysozyme family protein
MWKLNRDIETGYKIVNIRKICVTVTVQLKKHMQDLRDSDCAVEENAAIPYYIVKKCHKSYANEFMNKFFQTRPAKIPTSESTVDSSFS